jgi:hypothetical protein
MKRIHMVSMLLLAGLAMAGCKKEAQMTEPGDVNLAGCEVPAGVTREAAEQVKCAKSDASERPAAAPSTSESAGQPMTSDAAIVEAAIAEWAKQDGSSEYTDARRSIEGDVNGDRRSDLAVMYTLEGANGGNGAVRYLAGFVREAGQLRLAGITSLAGSEQDVQLKDGTVHLKLLSLGPDDSACCPSVEEDATYVLHGNKWLLVQAQP